MAAADHGGPGPDLYQLLGVPREASREEIAQAWRRRARAEHPDSRPGDAAAPGRFRALAEAWQVLGDPGRRAAYDRALAREQQPRPSGSRSGGRPARRDGRHEAAGAGAGAAAAGGTSPGGRPASGTAGGRLGRGGHQARRAGRAGPAVPGPGPGLAMVNPGWADLDRGLFSISVAAELAGLHPQTLRIYEREGLLDPARSAGGTRRYSRRDIGRLPGDLRADRRRAEPGRHPPGPATAGGNPPAAGRAGPAAGNWSAPGGPQRNGAGTQRSRPAADE